MGIETLNGSLHRKHLFVNELYFHLGLLFQKSKQESIPNDIICLGTKLLLGLESWKSEEESFCKILNLSIYQTLLLTKNSG